MRTRLIVGIAILLCIAAVVYCILWFQAFRHLAGETTNILLKSVESPDKKYVVDTFLSRGGATVENRTFASIRETASRPNTEFSSLLIQFDHDAKLEVEWLANDKVTIYSASVPTLVRYKWLSVEIRFHELPKSY